LIVRPVGDGVEIAVRASPRARRTEVAGPFGDRAIRIRIAAPPADGAANEALRSFLSTLFGVPAGDVSLIRGRGSREKVVHLRGIDAARARRILEL